MKTPTDPPRSTASGQTPDASPTDNAAPGATPAEGGDLFVSVLLDRSGSMASIREDMCGGFDSFIQDLRTQPGKTIVSLTQFDSQSIDVVCDAVPVAEVTPLELRPRGGTPLLDAIGRTLTHTEDRVKALPWTGRVLFVIMTDGLENASREWTRERLFTWMRELDARPEWGFLYLGADAATYADARSMGFDPSSVAMYKHSAKGARGAHESLKHSSRRFRGGYSKQELLTKSMRDAMNEDDEGTEPPPSRER